MIRGILLVLLSCVWQPLRAQTATATLDSSRIAVGSVATLTLEVRVPAGTSVTWPVLPDSLGKLEVLERTEVDTAREAGGVVYRQQARITGFDSGMFAVPALSFPTGVAALQTAPVPLLVETVPVDTTKAFRPIKDILEVPRSWLDYWPYLLAGLLLLSALLYFLLRQKGKPSSIAKPRGSENPSTAALRALQELEKSGLAERGAMGEFFTRASDILRHYLESRFGIPALEEPTDSMLRTIHQRDALKPQAGVLRQFFLTADLAKFAKATPTLEESKDAIGQARAFIHAVDRGGNDVSKNG